MTAMFDIKQTRKVFFAGDDASVLALHRVLAPFPFLRCMPAGELPANGEGWHFLIGVLDFTQPAALAKVVRTLTAHDQVNVHKVAFVSHPLQADEKHMLVAAEAGCRYTAVGPERDSHFRDHMKATAIEVERLGSISFYEDEMDKLHRRNDRLGLEALAQKVAEAGRGGEESLRLLAMIHQRLLQPQKLEATLKKLLRQNPQNLWAANTLGRHYLRSRRIGEAVETFEKLSVFQDLNAERLLMLTDIYLNTGDAMNAHRVLGKVKDVAAPDDERLRDAQVKVGLIDGKVPAGLMHAGAPMSEDVVAFLNMRAILAMRAGRQEDGIKLYQFALRHVGEGAVLKAKLMFNVGLGYIRCNEPEKALTYFEQSAKLGGSKFDRATAPLDLTRRIVKTRERKLAANQEDQDYLAGMEWEEVS